MSQKKKHGYEHRVHPSTHPCASRVPLKYANHLQHVQDALQFIESSLYKQTGLK